MTEPSQALDELVRQHEMLRARMDECEYLADCVDGGRGDLGALVRQVAALREAFEAHNHFEEQVLRPILRTLDAFGEARIEYMVADHIYEHTVLGHRLDGPTAELRATLYALRAHLACEERYFLSARVLRDDVVSVEATG
jgi:iron-sulfur cluster repair protein YtfE (RIC family)